MKIAFVSDVHLEFGSLTLENTENADVLVLAGDICVASELQDHNAILNSAGTLASEKYHNFFQDVANKFPLVLYVAGNHEHYEGDFALTLARLKTKLAYIKNLHVMDKEYIIVDGMEQDVVFVAGTLWTDMKDRDPLIMHIIKHGMNDFQCVKNSASRVMFKTVVDGRTEFHWRDAKFSPTDAADDHDAMMNTVNDVCLANRQEKIVVVSHHAPTHMSIHERYRGGNNDLNYAYFTDLSEFILDRPQIKLWIHGHVHDDFDYMVGCTRVVCNPRGYVGFEGRADSFKLKTVEV